MKELTSTNDPETFCKGFACIVLTKLLFRLDETFVSTRWNFYFILVELLFRPGGTVVSTWWNSSFVLMKHAIRLLIEPGSSARSVTPV